MSDVCKPMLLRAGGADAIQRRLGTEPAGDEARQGLCLLDHVQGRMRMRREARHTSQLVTIGFGAGGPCGGLS
jgi:hypothetical protein